MTIAGLASVAIGCLVLMGARLSQATPEGLAHEVRDLLADGEDCANVGRLLPDQPPKGEREPRWGRAGLRRLLALRRSLRDQGEDDVGLMLARARLDVCLGNHVAALDLLPPSRVRSDPEAAFLAGLALLTRGIEGGSPFDLLRGASMLRFAKDARPEDLAVATSYAEALRGLHLVETRRRLLRDLVARESRAVWRDHLHAELETIERRRVGYLRAQEIFASSAVILGTPGIAEWVVAFPYAARHAVEEGLLGAWARSMLHGDRAAAEGARLAADRIAGILHDELGDPFLRDAVACLRPPEAVNALGLASAFAHYQVGIELYRRRDRDPSRAIEQLRGAAAELEGLACPFWPWPAHLAAALDAFQHPESSSGRLRDLLGRFGGTYPVLRGHLLWQLGAVVQYGGDAHAALGLYERSLAPITQSSGRREGAIAHHHIAWALSDLSLIEKSWHHRLQAFEGTLGIGDRWRQHSVLYAAAHSLARLGLPELAAPVLDEMEHNVRAWKRVPARAELELLRAKIAASLGEVDAARAAVERARRAVQELPDGSIRARLAADTDLAEGLVLAVLRPEQAIRLLERGLGGHRTLSYAYERLAALEGLAVAADATGDQPRGAELRWQRLQELAGLRRSIRDPIERSLAGFMLERAVADDLRHADQLGVEAAVARMEMVKPFAAADRRATGTSGRAGACPPAQIAVCAQRQLRPREMLVSYLAGTEELLVAWLTQRGSGVVLRRIRHDWLPVQIESFVGHLRSGNAGTSRTGAALAALLLPSGDLASFDRLIVVPDRALHHVPFQALPMDDAGTPLAAQKGVTFYPSLESFVRARRSRKPDDTPIESVLAIGDPMLASPFYDELDDLEHARRSATEIAARYPRHKVLIRGDATLGTVLALLPDFDVAHFGTHAVANLGRDGVFGIVLAPDDTASDGLLTAEDVAALDLTGVRALVLAGCGTALGADQGQAVLWGLPWVALEAGAGAVIATIEPIDDKEAAAVTGAFHDHLLATRDPVLAYSALVRQVSELPPSGRSMFRNWFSFRLIGG